LSKKTINRHASGAHVPTRITVTLAAHKQANLESSESDSSTCDLSGDSDGYDPHPLVIPADGEVTEDLNTGTWNTLDEDQHGGLPEIIQKAWSRSRNAPNEYNSDDEDDHLNQNAVENNENTAENGSQPMAGADMGADTDSDVDSEFEWEGSGMRNGLGMEDLVDEDF
jgi:hypothetical protein